MALPENWVDIKLFPAVSEAITALGWAAPTDVQRACIPQILKGRDVAVQSDTGSGKTGAFAIPIAQRILSERATGAAKQQAGPTALVLLPSIELTEQTAETINNICRFVKPRVKVENVCERTGNSPPLTTSSAFDVLVSTPASLAKQLRASAVEPGVIQALRLMVIDEADLLVSMTSLAVIQALLPSTLQTVLVSATLNEGVATMKGQLLRYPTTIKLAEEEVNDDDGTLVVDNRVAGAAGSASKLKQFYIVSTDEYSNHTIIYTLFRLNLIEGKTIIFVDDDEETFKLQHFLEQLGIATVVYDVTMPLNVRLNMLQRFQKNSSGTLICTDNTLESAERVQFGGDDDKESGLNRGIDFSRVNNVLQFNGMAHATATNFASYTHRVGRTARAGQAGTAITIFTLAQARLVTGPLRMYLKGRDEQIRPFKKLNRSDAAKLQYRADTALANVTRTAARKLRVATVASEMAKSTYLSTHLNQQDSDVLRGIVARVNGKVKVDKALSAVPKYMKMSEQADDVDAYRARVKAQHPQNRDQVFKSIIKRKKADPLQQVVAKVRKTEMNRKEVASKKQGGGKAGKNPAARPAATKQSEKKSESASTQKAAPRTDNKDRSKGKPTSAKAAPAKGSGKKVSGKK
jgi:ATP-dependent RNA helicase DDX56/DBP9